MGSRIHEFGHMSLGRSDPEMTDLWGGGTTVQLSPERGTPERGIERYSAFALYSWAVLAGSEFPNDLNGGESVADGST
jgi:hypothetical protein